MDRMRLFKVSSVCILVAISGLACTDKNAQEGQQMPPAPVVVVTVRPETIPADYQTVGQTEGSLEVEVRARVSGIMDNFTFQEGGMVKKGQPLFQIDARPFQIALEQAQADLASAQATYTQAQSNIERIQTLYSDQAVSKSELDSATAAADTAKASVMRAQANVNDAKLNLVYTKVEAPITGIISKSIPSRGTLVTAQQTLLTKISQVDPMYVSFSYSDQDYDRMRNDIKAGRLVVPEGGKLSVSLTLADKSVYPYTGTINFQDISIDTGTSTIQTRATIPNPDRLLRPGQFVETRVTGLYRPNAITVPQRAVLEGQTGKFVYVVNQEDKAEYREVEAGDWYQKKVGDEIENLWVINKGLKAGDRVIVDGVLKVRKDGPVMIVPPKGAQSNAVPGAARSAPRASSAPSAQNQEAASSPSTARGSAATNANPSSTAK